MSTKAVKVFSIIHVVLGVTVLVTQVKITKLHCAVLHPTCSEYCYWFRRLLFIVSRRICDLSSLHNHRLDITACLHVLYKWQGCLLKGRVRQFFLLSYLMPPSMTLFELKTAMWTLFERQYHWRSLTSNFRFQSK